MEGAFWFWIIVIVAVVVWYVIGYFVVMRLFDYWMGVVAPNMSEEAAPSSPVAYGSYLVFYAVCMTAWPVFIVIMGVWCIGKVLQGIFWIIGKLGLFLKKTNEVRRRRKKAFPV